MLSRINDLESAILKFFGILLIIVIIFYAIINIWGNIAIARANAPTEDGYPSVRNAPYQFTLQTTGQRMFAKKYDTPAPGVYTLRYGHYEEVDGKWVWLKNPLPPMDEKIFGAIEVVKR